MKSVNENALIALKKTLTLKNKRRYNTIKWLTQYDVSFENKGRSTLMAVALVEAAISNPGKGIYLFDPCEYFYDASEQTGVVFAVEDFILNFGFEGLVMTKKGRAGAKKYYLVYHPQIDKGI